MHRITWITASLLAFSAEMKVTVIDPTGKAVQAAIVSADCARGRKQSVRTDGIGHARLSGLPSGSCRVVVQQPGFEIWSTTLPFEEGKEAHVDVALELARRQETVAVKESLGKRFKNWLTSCTRH